MTAEPDGVRPFAFICHAHEDREEVDALVAELGRLGIATWHDKEIPNGTRWTQVLTKKIDACAAFVVVMSPRAGESQFVRREIARAVHGQIPTVPLLLEGEPAGTLKHLQYSRLEPDGRPTADCVQSLRAAMDRRRLVRPWWGRPATRVAAAAVVVLVAAVATLLSNASDLGRTAGQGPSGASERTSQPGTPAGTGASSVSGERRSDGGCKGLPAEITAVSSDSPGHTGFRPRITVRVCAAPAAGHEFWLMNYVLEQTEPAGQARVYYTKVKVDGATGSNDAYPVTHSDATEAGSIRFYVVVDVPPELAATAAVHSKSDAGRPLGRNEKVPPGMALVSDEWQATL